MNGVVTGGSPDMVRLSRRHEQVLRGLLAGMAEKQIAYHLDVSQHTVHVYVRALYKRFGVSARSELLALWINPVYRFVTSAVPVRAPARPNFPVPTACPDHIRFYPGC